MRSRHQDSFDPAPGPSYGGPGGGPSGGGVQFAMPSMSPVVKRLILANAVVFLLSFGLSFGTGWALFRDAFGLLPSAWREHFPLVPVWQVFTYGFLHDTGNLFHIVGNMLFLYFLGTLLEGIIGGRRFLATYVTALLVSGSVMLLTGILANESRPTIGASGAVLAVVVATAVLRPNTRVIFLIFPITLKTLALIYVGFDLFNALSGLKGVDNGVANLAHLGGAAYGYVAARRGWIWKDPAEGLQQRREERRQEREVEDTRRVDELLEKIHREGIHSLSAREKAFLKRASKR